MHLSWRLTARFVLFITSLSLFALLSHAQVSSTKTSRKTPTPPQAFSDLVRAVDAHGKSTTLNGYVAVVTGIADNYFELVPAKAIALAGGPTRSKLLCLVRKKQATTILMIDTVGDEITAFALSSSGTLLKAAKGLKYQEFDTIPPSVATTALAAEKQFWFGQLKNFATP